MELLGIIPVRPFLPVVQWDGMDSEDKAYMWPMGPLFGIIPVHPFLPVIRWTVR